MGFSPPPSVDKGLGKNGLLASLLGQDGSRFMLSIWMVSQLWRAGGDGTLEDGLLQVVKHRRVLFSEESHGYTTLTSTTRTTNTMDVVCKRRKCNNDSVNHLVIPMAKI